MARPTLLRHRKFARLSRAVGSRILALGALSMLWEACYDAGDEHVGTAADVAFVIGWPGDSDVDITAALVEAGFVDEDPARPGEFVVHDLWDHAPDYVAKRRKRELERQARGARLRHAVDERRTNGGQTAPDGGQRLSDFRSRAPSPAQEDQDPGLSAGIAPCGNVEKSERAVGEVRKSADTERVIGEIVFALMQETAEFDGYGEAELKEDTKRRCARLKIPYDAEAVRKALDSAHARRARVEHGANA